MLNLEESLEKMPKISKLLRLLISEIKDPPTQNNFVWLQDFLNEEDMLQGRFKHFDFDIKGAVTNGKFPHNLNFQPLDIIQTLKTGAGSVTFNYDRFDSSNLDITTDGACRVRFFAGRFE